MRRLIGLWLLVYLVASWVGLSAGFKFSHKNSTVRVGSSKFIVNQPITGWNGTLERFGSVAGSTISFLDGILEDNGAPARFTGSYDGSALRQVTLGTSQSLRIDPGAFAPKITVVRNGNKIEGQPFFLNSDSLDLAHQLSSVTLSLQSALSSNIVMNQGTIILGDSLSFGDDRTLTGSGKVIFNRKQFAFGGKDLHLTHTLDWVDATDMVLNGRTSLSGIWTFTGVEARLNGNGNVLDLTPGGTILIKAGTTLYIADLKIRGLGIGQIIFEDKSSRIRMTDSQVEVVSNLTFTTGGIYIEGDATIITGNKTLTFAQQATLTVDQVTILYDTLTFNDTNNIQPLVGAAGNPGGKNVASVNNGKICHLDCGLSALSVNNSNAIISNAVCCRVNSNALLYLNKNTSNTELRFFANNSNAILACCKNASNSIINLDNRITNNSNAIISNAACCRVNSNALLYLNKNTSNAQLRLFTNNSNAIINLVNASSSNAECCRVNSNAILYLTKNNSNALIAGDKNNSNTLLYLDKNNSNALLNCCKNASNTILYLTKNLSNALIAGDKNNSNTLLYLDKNNSNALIECCKDNSNSLLFLTKNNSNTLLFLAKNNSNALIECCKDNSNSLLFLTKNNSNTLLFLAKNNSNALLECCKDNSNTLLFLNKNNSNAIVKIEAELHCCTLVVAPVTTDVLMDCNCIVSPVKVINILDTLTIDGQGAWIEFCSPTTPQFVVAAGATVTLQNVTLMRINQNTFSLGAGASIVIGDNVTFELEDDLVLNGENFTVAGTINDPFVWTIRGIGGKRRLILAQNAAAGQYITLGFNTLLLQEVELSGVENISITRGLDAEGTIVVGALAFGGGAEVNIEKNTDATFVVEGNRNALRMLDTGLALTGFILYSDLFDSELHFSFHLQDPIVGNPSVIFGPDLLFLSSALGRASIIFDDFWATIINRNGNSFVTDANAFIGGHNVEVNSFPIKQASADLILDSGLTLRSDQLNAIDRSFIRVAQFRKQPRTHIISALDIKRMREFERMQENIAVSNRPQRPKLSSNREKQKQNKYGRKKQTGAHYRELLEEMVAQGGLSRSLMSGANAHFQALKAYVQDQIRRHKTVKREFVLPTSFQFEQGGSVVKLGNASDNVLIHTGGVGSDFGIDPVNQLNLYLGNNISGDGTVRQGFKDTTLKPNDKIFVRNLNNRIQIQEHFTIRGEIVMTPASELIFEFLDNGKDPVLFFDAEEISLFDIPHDALVRFIGRGKVVFGDGFTMRLEGGKLTPERTKLIFDEGVLVTLGDDESTVIIDGDGKLLFDRGAQLNLRAGQHLIIGRLDEPTLPPDGIDITLDREAEWNLNEDVDGDDIVREGDARLSIIGSSTFSLRVDDDSKIYIGNQGVLEINALDDERLDVPGVLTNLAFISKGTLSFEDGGKFVLGLNKNFVKTFVDTKKGILQTDGTGIAQFASKDDAVTVQLSDGSMIHQGNAFAGLIQDNGQFIGLKGLFTGREIIRRLINIIPTLTFSTFFIDENANKKLELLGGEGSIQSPMFIIQLDANDQISNDNAAEGLVIGFNGSGKLFTIDQSGNRIVSRVIAYEAELGK